MAVDPEIHYAHLNDLYLDPMNPRLGRNNTGSNVSQDKVLELMKDWTLDELALSFMENGYWPQEALLATHAPLYGSKVLVVVEGNRRLAALKYLYGAIHGNPASKRWKDIAQSGKVPETLFTKIPYILIGSRKDVEAFLGFRHVTGIKEWKPAEKAEYIAKMIENSGMSYEEVMRKIGSKTPTVRSHYISYRVLLQMEDEEDIAVREVEDKFSVLYLSLRTEGVRKYLQIDIKASPKAAKKPVPASRLRALAKFALWLFGDERREPVVKDSRQVDDFGRILESKKAVEYLERSERPNFETAFGLAGGDEPEIVRLVEQAADNIELALSRAHLHSKSEKLSLAVERLGADAIQLLRVFPAVEKEVLRSGT